MKTICAKSTFLSACSAILLATLLTSQLCAQKGMWTDPEDKTLGIDFKIQGEYSGKNGDEKFGCQVIALGADHFQAVVYPGGLPGDGWDGENKSLLDGKVDGESAKFVTTKGERKYLGQKAAKFSATENFPPTGQKDYSAIIANELMTLAGDDEKITLKKTARNSPTLGLEPAKNAIVLFDGSSIDQWKGGRLDETTKLLNTDGKDILTKKKFNNYTMHLEFMMPYKPAARGQGRGNSGFYQVDHYEMQILDSFGLEGKNNECGGIYQKKDSDVNMCFPPLTWQTYDVQFTNAVADESGKKIKNARLTARLNGVVIHDDFEIPGKTGGSRGEPEGTPGSIKLQGHGNPLQYRNVWIVENE